MSSWKYIDDSCINSPCLDDCNHTSVERHYYTTNSSYDYRRKTDSSCIPPPIPCSSLCPYPPPFPPCSDCFDTLPTSQHIEAYTLDPTPINTLTASSLSAHLSFITAGESHGLDISHSTTTPQSIILNAPGYYLIMVKGLVSFNINNTTSITPFDTLTILLTHDNMIVDQLIYSLAMNSLTQNAFSLHAIVCNSTAPSTIRVKATASRLRNPESISYNDLNIIVIKLSDQPCTTA